MKNDYLSELEMRKKKLQKLEKRLKKDIEKAPEDKIYFFNARGNAQFYRVEQGRRRYLPAAEREKGCLIVQRDYDKKLLKLCQKEEEIIERFLKDYRPDAVEEFIQSLTPARRAIIDVKYELGERFLEQMEAYAAEQYQRITNSYPVADRFVTKRGEAVRSKSELIIADLLADHDLTYYYELPLELSGGAVAFPDFSIVDQGSRKMVYWEHFGLTDDFNYSVKMAAKLNAYERSGIFPGENLIMTMESRDCPLDVGLVKAKIKKYLVQ
jgi:hypothetical protein